MKINGLSRISSFSANYAFGKYSNNSVQNSTEKTTSTKKDASKGNVLLASAGVIALGAAGIFLYKKIDSHRFRDFIIFGELSYKLTKADKKFYKKIQKSLAKSGIKVKTEDLRSIVTPDELLWLTKRFKPENFRAGLQVSEANAKNIPLNEYFKNTVDGNFRVSLHTHSNRSDGKATPEEFLECARKYADKVASRRAKDANDELPPFTIALTDHDCVDGCIEIIKIIARNPKKYKNLKFVSGCEFSVRNGRKRHDITGLALNPFESNLRKSLTDLREQRLDTVKNFLKNQPEYNGKKVTFPDLVNFENEFNIKHGNEGKHCIEGMAGTTSVRHAINFYYKLTNQKVDKHTRDFLGDKDVPDIKEVLKNIHENGGKASLTHPVKSFWRYIGDDYLLELKKMGVSGIEVNHQYTPSNITEVGKKRGDTKNADKLFEELTAQYKNFADKNDMFLSGGTDSHEKQIFSREPKISKDFLENYLLK